MPLDAERVVLLAGGAAMLCLAGAILAVDARRRANRAFAALLAARGLTVLLPQMSNDPGWTVAALRMQPYFVLASIPVALYCLYLFPRSDRSKPGPRAGWLTVAAVAVLDLAYWLNHGLFHEVAYGEPANEALRAGPGLYYATTGPLAALGALAPLLLALLALRFALTYRHEARGANGTTLLLLSAGFLVGALFDGASRLLALADLLDRSAGYPWLPWGWAVAVLPATALLPALLTVAVLAAGRRSQPRPLHALEGRLLVLAFVALGAGFLRLATTPSADPAGHPLTLVLLGMVRLTTPVLVAYALLLRAFRGLDAKVQEALAWIAAVAVVGLAGWAIAAVLGGRVPAPWPALGGLLAAALVATQGRRLVAGARAAVGWLLPPREAATLAVAAVVVPGRKGSA